MIKLFLISFLIFSPGFMLPQDSLLLIPAAGFPAWLKTSEYAADQTSGIAYIKSDDTGRHFLLADDVGSLHHLAISNDSVLSLKKIFLSTEVRKYIAPFPKKDFEEILYDRSSGKVYLSIEGNNPTVKSVAGIYELTFLNGNVFSDTVTAIRKIKIIPEDKFLEHTDNNVCFEGLASDDKYLYAALEGFSKGIFFADSTLIYVISKSDNSIKKIISTHGTGVETICGLYSDKNFSLYGVDRNNKNFFHLTLTEELEIKSVRISEIHTAVPNYHAFDYVVSFESVTMDENNNFYLVDDPWKRFYVPPEEVLNKLDEETVRNFKNFVPVIYKFKLKN